MNEAPAVVRDKTTGFIRGLGLLDSTMIVSGSMIGSGIFIVSADIARNVGSAGGLLLVWIVTGLLTIAAALSYGELAGMMPNAGGQYVYLREAYSPLWGFLYGWTMFLVIQTGTIAAVGVHHERLFPFSPGQAYDRNLTYRAGRCPARSYLPELIPLARRLDAALSGLFTHWMRLADGASAYRTFAERRQGCLKVALSP